MGWRGYRRNQRLDMADGMANVLLSRGIVELDVGPVAVAQAPAPEVKTMVPPTTVTVEVAPAMQQRQGKRRA